MFYLESSDENRARRTHCETLHAELASYHHRLARRLRTDVVIYGWILASNSERAGSSHASQGVHRSSASPGFAPPPPTLPKSVPLHIRGPVDVAVRAAKQAWLIETKRADILGKEVSDEHLNNLYRRGRQWYARHADKTDVRPPRNSLTLGFPRAMRDHVIRTCLMLRR